MGFGVYVFCVVLVGAFTSCIVLGLVGVWTGCDFRFGLCDVIVDSTVCGFAGLELFGLLLVVTV